MIGACVMFAGMATCIVLAHRADPLLSPWWTSLSRAVVNGVSVAAIAGLLQEVPPASESGVCAIDGGCT